MYELIDAHHSVRQIYTQQLLQRGDIGPDEEKQLETDFRARLDTAFAETHASDDAVEVSIPQTGSDLAEPTDTVVTSVALDVLDPSSTASRLPEGFAANQSWNARSSPAAPSSTAEIDWALPRRSPTVAGAAAPPCASPGKTLAQHLQPTPQCARRPAERAQYGRSTTSSDTQAPFMVYDTAPPVRRATSVRY
jgi:hypothetical protein